MTDLTFCYLHMTPQDLEVLDTIGTSDYIAGDISDNEIEMPSHMKPPNPDDSDVLPSEVHPSYPFGNPNSIKHPASRPRRPWDPSSRALFEDMGYAGGGINGALRWKDLALDILLPVDEEKELAERAAHARKMASGITSHPPHPPQQPHSQTVIPDQGFPTAVEGLVVHQAVLVGQDTQEAHQAAGENEHDDEGRDEESQEDNDDDNIDADDEE